MKLAIVGCGFVAEQYANCLAFHPELEAVAAFDRDGERLRSFAIRNRIAARPSLDHLLGDPEIRLILNLTNPREHFAINKACLEAGKHVYSEKPLAMRLSDASALAVLASERDLHLSSAPCSVLSETAQTLWRAVRANAVGTVRLVYASFEDGMIAPNRQPWTWRNEAGASWPAKDEFEVGCTFEHGGYVLTWLCTMFGPARAVTAFASVQIPDKGIAVEAMAPDFSVGCIEWEGGVVARVTCGLVAPRERSLTIVGDRGELFVANVRDDAGPVMLRRAEGRSIAGRVVRRVTPLARFIEDRLGLSALDALTAVALPLAGSPTGVRASPSKRVDFLRGPADMAEAIMDRRPSRLSADMGVHLVEILTALQYPAPGGARRLLTTTFVPMAPMPWAS